MRYLFFLLLFAQIALFAKYSVAQNIRNSPYNMENSPYNMENSPYNSTNSPYNINNSQFNLDATNGVYSNQGQRIGYEVKAPSGVVNYFDNNGNRIGYTPSQK